MGFDRIAVGLGIAAACLFGNASCGDNVQGTNCGEGTLEFEGECRPTDAICGAGTVFDEDIGLCLPGPIDCVRGTVADGNHCIPDGSVICDDGTTFNASSGRCQSDIAACGMGTVLDGVTCVSLDDAIAASHEEEPEPNDDDGLAGSLDVPNLTGNRTIYGCIQPIDIDGNGTIDIDRDSYRLTANGPSLVDISVDGIGGLSGAFVIRATSGALLDDGWSRTGLNLVSDTSRRQVFLPAAGEYLLDIVDGRSLLVPEPVGSTDTCYLASIRNIVLPTATSVDAIATGTLGTGVHLLSFGAQSDGDIVQDLVALGAPTSAASLAMVHMRAGRYAGGVQGGSSVADTTPGLLSTSNLLIVVEPEFNYSLDPVPFEYTLNHLPSEELVSGSATSVPVGDALGLEMAWTPVAKGDVVRLRIDDPDISVFSLDRRLVRETQLCAGCANSEFFYQATETGLLYLGISHTSALGSFDVVIDRLSQTPLPLAVDSQLSDLPLGPDGLGFLETVQEALAWTSLNGTPTNFVGDLQAQRYPRTSGFLDAEVSPIESLVLAPGSPRLHISDALEENLWRVSDSAFDGTADSESLELSLSSVSFADLLPTSTTPIELTAIAIAGGEVQRYLLRASPGEEVELMVSPIDAIDLSIRQLSEFESVVVLEDSGAVGELELVQIVMPESGQMPLSVQTATEAGSYDLSAAIVATP